MVFDGRHEQPREVAFPHRHSRSKQVFAGLGFQQKPRESSGAAPYELQAREERREVSRAVGSADERCFGFHLSSAEREYFLRSRPQRSKHRWLFHHAHSGHTERDEWQWFRGLAGVLT